MKTLSPRPLLFAALSAWTLLALSACAPATPPPSPPPSPPAPNRPAPIPPPKSTAAEARAIGFGPTTAAAAKVTKLADGFGFTEGATAAPNGDLYFVDQDNNRIHKWSVTDNKVSIFLEPSGRSNGQIFDSKGNLLACADEKNELWSITPDGKHTVVISSAGYQGKPLDGPNDVWVRADGGIYITDPHYGRTWWDKAVARPSQSIRAVYYLAPGAKELKRVAQDFVMPNGIHGTADGKTLFIADLGGDKTYAFDIQPDGSLTNRHLVANCGSDGITTDTQGNLYLTADYDGIKGVTIVDPKTGKLVGFIEVPEQPANLSFAGKNHDQLFLTARTGLYVIQMKVKGANTTK